MPRVGTMSSLAGNDAKMPTVIFQSKPAGWKMGSTPFPSFARYEFSVCAEAICGAASSSNFCRSVSSCVFSFLLFSRACLFSLSLFSVLICCICAMF